MMYVHHTMYTAEEILVAFASEQEHLPHDNKPVGSAGQYIEF